MSAKPNFDQEKRLRVSFLSFDFGEYTVRLASALARDCDVQLLLPHSQAEGHLNHLAAGVTFDPFDKPRLRQPHRQALMIGHILRAIGRFRPDVIHLQQGHLWFNLALPLLSNYPLVVTVHDPKPHLGDREGQKTPERITHFGFRRANRIIAHGSEMKKTIIEECKISGEDIDVIPHVVLGSSVPKPEHEEQGLVLFLGRIWEYKGLDYLIRAEPLIADRFPMSKIAIVGKGEDFARYRQMMANPDRFIVRNEYVSDEERQEWLDRASVVVLPYVEATQSGVIPLAYSAGKPVVATTVGSLPDQVDDGATGYLVPPRDEHALADRISDLLCDPELRKRFGENGNRKVAIEWSPEAVAAKTLAVYEQVAGVPTQRLQQPEGALSDD